MSWLHNFLSNFHHTEDAVTLEGKQILQHVEYEFKALEDEFMALEARVKALETVAIAPIIVPLNPPVA